MITTIYGDMDETLLTPNHTVIDNSVEYTTITEFRLKDEVVHRSVHVTLKQGIGVEGVLGMVA